MLTNMSTLCVSGKQLSSVRTTCQRLSRDCDLGLETAPTARNRLHSQEAKTAGRFSRERIVAELKYLLNLELMLKVHFSFLLVLCRPDPLKPARVPERLDLHAAVEEDACQCGLNAQVR